MTRIRAPTPGGSVRLSTMDIPTSALRRALSLPEPVIRSIAGPPPTVDGNTLDPSVHMLLWLADRITAARPREAAERRRDMRANADLVMPWVPGVHTEEHLLAGRVPARSYRTGSHPAPLLMYLHGGGWVVGDLDTHDRTCRMLALHSRCTVVSVGYALAPERPFPAGLDDAVAAFDDLSADPQRFNGLAQGVAVGGDSAGANLAAALCLLRHPRAAALIYPATDLRMTSASISTFADGYFLTRDDMSWYRDQYLPDPGLVHDARVSPLLADDVHGFPPTAIWTAGFDPLRDEGAAFAARLTEAGVPTSYTCLTDQIHGFLGMGVLPGGMRRIAEVGREIGRLIRPSGQRA